MILLKKLVLSQRICLCLFLLFLGNGSLFSQSGAAAVVWQESFETDGAGVRYTLSEICNDNFYDFFTKTDGSDIGSGYNVTGSDGSFYYAAQDTDGSPCTLAIQTITFPAIDITGHSELAFSGLFAEDDDGVNQDWDADSLVFVEYQIDAGGWNKILQFASLGSTNTEPGIDTDFDGVRDDAALTSVFSDIQATIPATGNSLELKLTIMNLASGDEDIAFDNFRIEDSSPPPPGVSIGGTPVALSESGTTDNYSIALDTLPSSQVDITIRVIDGETEVSLDNTNFGSSAVLQLSNTTSAPVYVRAVDDTDIENAHTGTISHSASSSDLGYDGITIDATSADITDNDMGFTKIHDVQGSGSSSPIAGNSVAIEGIVVGDFQQITELNGFFVQEEDADIDADAATSEGVFVYSSVAVNSGDKVQVTGTATEHFGLTEIGTVVDVSVISSGNSMPTPANVSLPLSTSTDLEAFEGMSVAISQSLYVTEHYNLGRGGYVTLSSGGRLNQPTDVALPGTAANAIASANVLNQIILDDGSEGQNPDPITFSNNPPSPLSAADSLRGGDVIDNITGVLSYHWDGWNGSANAYRIHPTSVADFDKDNPRPLVAPTLDGNLKVAAFNVLNYFTTIDNSGAICGPGANLDCRGADSAVELSRQRDKLIAALTKLDADIIGLMELENTNQDAIADLAAQLPGYDYIANPTGKDTELGDDAITVGVLYKTSAATPMGGSATIANGYGSVDLGESCGSASDGIYPFDNYNRKPLAQTFADANGYKFTVVVNHFKSKGSLTSYTLDADQLDGQGNNNCTRTQASEIMLEWLATDPTSSGNDDYLVMGDLNAYAMEDPITALSDAGYTNMISGYSYVYSGQWGSLDHILASASLAAKVSVGTKWHINSDEPRILDYNTEYKTTAQLTSLYNADEFRTSDHDPAIVGLTLGTAPLYKTLAVSKRGTGNGSITSTPAGINCGSDCTEDFSFNTMVTLKATADSTSIFNGWDGSCAGTALSYSLVMSNNFSCTANFTQDSDGDGMADDWEIQYGLNPNVDDASGDLDNDGYSNLEEYLAGTDPSDPNSTPGVVLAPIYLLLLK